MNSKLINEHTDILRATLIGITTNSFAFSIVGDNKIRQYEINSVITYLKECIRMIGIDYKFNTITEYSTFGYAIDPLVSVILNSIDIFEKLDDFDQHEIAMLAVRASDIIMEAAFWTYVDGVGRLDDNELEQLKKDKPELFSAETKEINEKEKSNNDLN
jgi:predicted aminopeptidase